MYCLNYYLNVYVFVFRFFSNLNMSNYAFIIIKLQFSTFKIY